MLIPEDIKQWLETPKAERCKGCCSLMQSLESIRLGFCEMCRGYYGSTAPIENSKETVEQETRERYAAEPIHRPSEIL